MSNPSKTGFVRLKGLPVNGLEDEPEKKFCALDYFLIQIECRGSFLSVSSGNMKLSNRKEGIKMKNLTLRIAIIIALFVISLLSLVTIHNFIQPLYTLHTLILILPVFAYFGWSSWFICDAYAELLNQKEMDVETKRYVEKLEESNSVKSIMLSEIIDKLSLYNYKE
jgi:uncharacterized protein YacL